MEKLTNFEDLQCWKISVELCDYVYNACEKAGLPAEDELACRWYVSALNISGKIAFAYASEDVERLKKYLPLARKYCMETVFWSHIALQKGYIKKSQVDHINHLTKRIVKKTNSISRYLAKYAGQEKHRWNVFFTAKEE